MNFDDFEIAESALAETIREKGLDAPALEVEKIEKYSLNVGINPLMTWLGVEMLAAIASWGEDKVMSNLEELGLDKFVIGYMKTCRMGIGMLMDNARSTLNAAITVVADNMPDADIRKECLKGEKMETSQLEAKIFAMRMEASHETIKDNNANYIKSMGHWDSDVAFVRFGTNRLRFYEINLFCRKIFKYKADTVGEKMTPRFWAPKLPVPESLPEIAAKSGAVTLLAHYSKAVFKDFEPWFQKFPLFAIKAGTIPDARPAALIDHANEVCSVLLGSTATYQFSFAWAKIIARGFHYDEPFPKERVFCILARYLGISVFHGPLEGVVKWFYGKVFDLISVNSTRHDDVEVRIHNPKTAVISGALMYAFTPELVKKYVHSRTKISALIFPWSAVAKAVSDAYSSYFQFYHAASIFFLFGERVCVALAQLQDGDDIAVSDIQTMWPLINNFIIACFYDQWFAIRKCHVVRLTFKDGSIELIPYDDPAPVVRIYKVEKADKTPARLVPTPFKPNINLRKPRDFGVARDQWSKTPANGSPTYATSNIHYPSSGTQDSSPLDTSPVNNNVPPDNDDDDVPAYLSSEYGMRHKAYLEKHVTKHAFFINTDHGRKEIFVDVDGFSFLKEGAVMFPVKDIFSMIRGGAIRVEGGLFIFTLESGELVRAA